MILLEQHIELKIYHAKRLIQFNVIQTLKENAEISFKVLQDEDYIFTLVLIEGEGISFELSKLDRDLNIMIDWKLYSKIEAALYSVFLKEIPS